MKRFLSSLFFSVAFIWVAVVFFEVDTEVVYVLFVLSLMLVGMAIIAGLFIAPLVKIIRRRKSEHLLTEIFNANNAQKDSREPPETSD